MRQMVEHLGELIARVDWSAVLWAGLWTGLVAFTLGLSFLLWTRWGYYHLTGKCVLFSVLAHLLLGLLFATAEVVDNVVIALARAEESPPITIERVHIVKTPENDLSESALDGRSDESAPVGIWDRPNHPVTVDSPSLGRDVPKMASALPVERPAAPDESLPRQTPKPEVPVSLSAPEMPRLAKSEPEDPERVEQLAAPPEPTAIAAEPPKEVLPENAPKRFAPAYGTGPIARSKEPASQNATPEPAEPSHSAIRAPTNFPPTAGANVPSAPPRIVGTIVRPEAQRNREADSNSLGQPIATPEASPKDAVANRTGTGSSALQPSTTVRAGLTPGSSSGKEATAPIRAGSPGGDGLPLPPAKLGGSAGTATKAQPGPSSVRPVAPVGAGRPAANREGMRLGTPEIYRERMNPNRSEQAVHRGGSKESEEAVERALAWLAAHQDTDGHWDADGFHLHCPAGDVCSGPGAQSRDDCAMTGLVLLAFLGAGNTHQSGQYDLQVVNGLNWLLSQEKLNGDLRGTGRMYSQGIATLALSEALGMTGDPKLRDPVERAVKFIVAAQHPSSGGWRYVPGQYGDTSILGWQLLALKSATLAGVSVPETTWQKARGWLALVASGRSRGLASYLPGQPATPTMTAEAMACRLFLGASTDDPAVREAADYIMEFPPHTSRQNLYYWYYGTVASFQMGGNYWQQWNTNLRDPLIARQVRDGHAAGSWDPVTDPWGVEGGRIYSTALSTLCLEVYYRFLPLQSIQSEEAPGKAQSTPRPATDGALRPASRQQ